MDFAYFLAHASPDKPWVESLRDALKSRGVQVFYDKADIPWGADWDRFLPKAQARCWATVVCVSRRYDDAYYLREELHRAIAMERQDPNAHRVLPLFMDGWPTDPRHVPYGLTIKNGRDASTCTVDDLADELAEMAAAAGWAGITPAPSPSPAPAPAVNDLPDRLAIHAAMCELAELEAAFDQVFWVVRAPVAQFARQPPMAKARDLVTWAELQGDRTAPDSMVRRIVAEIRRFAPGLLP